MQASAVLCFFAAVVRSAEIVELHAENFDAAIADNDEVLVHFYAPCTYTRSPSRACTCNRPAPCTLATLRFLRVGAGRREPAVRDYAASPTCRR